MIDFKWDSQTPGSSQDARYFNLGNSHLSQNVLFFQIRLISWKWLTLFSKDAAKVLLHVYIMYIYLSYNIIS